MNPYADFGGTLSGERFVGREEELRLIGSRLFGEGGYGSLSIVGLPRIGKTSLVTEAVRRAKPILQQRRIVVAWVEVGSFGSVDDLLRAVVEDILENLRLCQWNTDLIEARAAQVPHSGPVSFNAVRGVFRALRLAGTRPVCILDEFDAGRYLFAGVPQCFHWLRELGSNPEFKAALVLISKRRLQDVARVAGHDSDYWSNILMSLTLRSFIHEDRDLMLDGLSRAGVVVPAKTLEEVTSVCGRHPFLLDAFAYHAWERTAQDKVTDTNWFSSVMGGVVRSYFDQVATILRDGPMLSKAVQAVAGPQWDITPNDIEALVDYGVLDRGEGNRLRAFSEGFADYLRLVQASVDIWPLWRDAEKGLREVLNALLENAYGPDWQKELRTSRPKLRQLLDACEEKMAKEQTRFGVRAAPNLLAYTYPLDLYQIMVSDWTKLGEPVLGSDKQGWSVKFALLSKVRTPLAHNRDEAVQYGERTQAEGICREILSKLDAYHTAQGIGYNGSEV